MQFPVQFFVGITNEAAIVPFSVSATRGETLEDYCWVLDAFSECHGTLPKCVIVDGDEVIANAIKASALKLHVSVCLLLCIWHLFESVKAQLYKKGVQFDEFDLKKSFFALRDCDSEDGFEAKWALFVETYGTNDNAANYLRNHVYSKREMWVRIWTGLVFTANWQ
jgi:hypothetical protein